MASENNISLDDLQYHQPASAPEWSFDVDHLGDKIVNHPAEFIQHLQAEREETTRFSRAMSNYIAVVEEDRAQQAAEIRELQIRLTTSQAQATNTKRSTRIPDPFTLNGSPEQKPEFHNWINLVRSKLSFNGDHYPDNTSKKIYVQSLLRDRALKIANGFTGEASIHTDSNLEIMLKQLEAACGKSNRVEKANQQLQTYCQANKPWNAFLADFQATASDSSYDDQSRKNYLINALSDEIRERIPYEIDTWDYPTTITQLTRVAHLIETYGKQRTIQRPLNPRFNDPQSDRRVFTLPITSSREVTPDSNAIDLSAGASSTPGSAGPRGPLSQNERERRRREGLCLYCGQSGHIALNCPSKPKSITRRLVARSASTT